MVSHERDLNPWSLVLYSSVQDQRISHYATMAMYWARAVSDLVPPLLTISILRSPFASRYLDRSSQIFTKSNKFHYILTKEIAFFVRKIRNALFQWRKPLISKLEIGLGTRKLFKLLLWYFYLDSGCWYFSRTKGVVAKTVNSRLLKAVPFRNTLNISNVMRVLAEPLKREDSKR